MRKIVEQIRQLKKLKPEDQFMVLLVSALGVAMIYIGFLVALARL